MASPTTAAASSAASADSELIEWLGQAGGSCSSGVRIGENSGERGLFATKDAPANAMLLFVPADLHIRAPAIADMYDVEREDDRLALTLLRAAFGSRTRKRWRPWIHSLPGSEYTTPLHWKNAAIALLGDEEFISSVERQQVRLRQRYDALVSHLQRHDSASEWPAGREERLGLGRDIFGLSFETYRWAYATIRSRAAYLGEEGAAQAIVPVGDLFNHSTTAPNVAAAYALPARAYVYTALQPIAAGDELLVSYGAHDNATLLKHYGFVPRGPNPHDRVAVALDDAPTTNLATGAAARAWLAEQGFDSGHALTHDGPSFELLAALRLRHATDDEYRNGAAFAIAEGEAVSDANEARVWRAVGDLARALARPPSEAEDDRRRIDALRQKPNVEAAEAHELLAREFRAARAALVEANVARAEREAREREGEGGAKRRRTQASANS